MRMSCIPTSAAIWYSVALKAPKGETAHTFWSSKAAVAPPPPPTTTINGWLTNVFTNTGQTWNGYLYYNDQMPDGAKEATFLNGVVNDGHCKGVLVWNGEKVGWLIHSMPKFPALGTSMCQKPGDIVIGENALTYGQSAAYIEIPRTRDTLDDVLIQIATMQAQIYVHEGLSDTIIDSMRRIYRSSKTVQMNHYPILAKRKKTITHIAKPNSGVFDIYETVVAKNSRGAITPIVCETWQNGAGGKTTTADGPITNLRSVGNKWDSSADHSKWAISMPYTHHGWFRTHMKNDWRVFVGDLNRMNSQHSRGGGGIIIDGDKALWEWFYGHLFG